MSEWEGSLLSSAREVTFRHSVHSSSVQSNLPTATQMSDAAEEPKVEEPVAEAAAPAEEEAAAPAEEAAAAPAEEEAAAPAEEPVAEAEKAAAAPAAAAGDVAKGPIDIDPTAVFNVIPFGPFLGPAAYVGMDKNTLLINGLIDVILPFSIGLHLTSCKPMAEENSAAWKKLALINTLVVLALGWLGGLGFLFCVILGILSILISLDGPLLAACATEESLETYKATFAAANAKEGAGSPSVVGLFVV